MVYAPIKAADYKIISVSNVSKDRQHDTNSISASSQFNNVKLNKHANWTGKERRSGQDRRLKNNVKQARLDARNKNDRRANQLSIEI